MKTKLEPLPKGILVPNHIAAIPDGNRRWARARGLAPWRGHARGFDITPAIARAVREMGVHTFTIWAFSTENWDRSKKEIDFLMKKYEQFVGQHLREAKRDKVRIFHLGRKDRVPKSLAKKLEKAEKETAQYTKNVLNIAIDYGGRDEIIRAVRKMVKDGLIDDGINEEALKKYLDTNGQPYPYPDLIIRTSGEQRTSGLLAWQGAYAEFFWATCHWPDFTPEKVREAIIEYSRRRRRYGGNDDVPKVRFDPQRLAKLEVGWWRAHNEKNKEKLGKLLGEWVCEQYGLKNGESEKATKLLLSAAINHDEKDWGKAIKKAKSYYQIIKKATNLPFDAETVARLEIDWWELHDRLENKPDKQPLEEALARLYGEVYRLSDIQIRKMAHLKALATQAHDWAESKGANGETEKFWKQTEDYLQKSYQALKEITS